MATRKQIESMKIDENVFELVEDTELESAAVRHRALEWAVGVGRNLHFLTFEIN